MKNYIFLGFVLVTLLAYWPSLQHAPKHDQLGFLGDMALHHNAWDKIAAGVDWNRERLFMGSDQFLFRPLLNSWLTLQLLVFGYSFTLWQGMAVLLHILVGFSLYRLLDTIRPGISAAAGAGFFLLMLSNLPMVVWHNISAYMIFCAFVLESTLRWLRFQRNNDDKASLWSAVLFLFLATYLFEAGVLFCLIFLLVSALTFRSKRYALFFFAPVVIYFILNIADFVFKKSIVYAEAGRIAANIVSFKTFLNFLIAFKWFSTTGIFLKASEIIPVERVAVSPVTLNFQWPFMMLNDHLIRGLALIVIFMWGVIFSYSRLTQDRRQLFTLLLLMISLFTLFICCGRVNTRGVVTGLFFNSYYIYFFSVLALPACYSLIAFDKIIARPDGRLFRLLAYILCGVVLYVSAFSIFNVNVLIAKTDRPRREFIDAMSRFVSAHSNEHDLSFFVPHTCSGNYAGKWLHRNSDPSWRRYTLSEVLFPQYYAARGNAKYLLSCRNDEILR